MSRKSSNEKSLKNMDIANFMGSNVPKKVNLNDKYSQTKQNGKPIKRFNARKG